MSGKHVTFETPCVLTRTHFYELSSWEFRHAFVAIPFRYSPTMPKLPCYADEIATLRSQ